MKDQRKNSLVKKISRHWIILVVAFLFGSYSPSYSQNSLNMNLLSNWDNNTLPVLGTTAFNDIWGYAAGGREFAIVGTIAGFFVFDITDPSAPGVITFEPGGSNSSLWRDFKTYQNYLYAVSDQGSGSSLQIFDLSSLPGSITKVYDSQAFFSTCHSIFVNPVSGRLYASGTTVSPSGVIILDIATDPANPALLANFTLGAYVHDIYVHNDTCVAFMGNTGVAIFDFYDLLNPSMIDVMLSYPDPGYAHSGAATSDFKYMYWATETHGTPLRITQFQPSYLLEVSGTFRSTLLAPAFTGSVGHNPFIKNDLLYVAYYHDGVQVWDISNRLNPSLTAYYDTHPQNTDYSNYDGCWGVYPYLPSGNIIASDRQNGLFILGQSTPFPVELSHFEVENYDNHVRINWITALELNNDHFMVQRSSDGDLFEDLERVNSPGDSQTDRSYEILDTHPLDGRSYYRLKQVDIDGSVTFSEAESVLRGKQFQFLGLFPNPVAAGSGSQLEFELVESATIQLTICDLLGKVRLQKILSFPEGRQQYQIDTHGWSNGSYCLKIISGNQSFSRKLMIMK